MRKNSAMWVALLIVCFAGGTLPLPAQTAKLYVSSKAGDRITAKPDVQFSGAKAGGATFQISDTVKFQKIYGFGASIMEAGLVVLNSLPTDKEEDVLRSLFDVKTGAGFTAMKTPLGGTDFQSAGPWFTYDDTTDDAELTHFSVDRDGGCVSALDLHAPGPHALGARSSVAGIDGPFWRRRGLERL